MSVLASTPQEIITPPRRSRQPMEQKRGALRDVVAMAAVAMATRASVLRGTANVVEYEHKDVARQSYGRHF